jgi:hypothetical protein
MQILLSPDDGSTSSRGVTGRISTKSQWKELELGIGRDVARLDLLRIADFQLMYIPAF